MSFLFSALSAFLVSVALLPAVLRLARSKGWYDSKDDRKIHQGDVPRLGGVAIAWGFFVATILVYSIYRPLGKLQSPGLHFWLLMGLGAGYHVLGLVDDFCDLRGRPKLAMQAIMAIGVVALGYGFTIIELPFAPFKLELGLFGPVLTFFWILGMCNAVNLIDGMDGLAGGVSFIAVAFWAIIFYMESKYLPAIVATAAGGAMLGFLFFNFPPATVFMGDSGSLFLGFILAVLPLLGDVHFKGETGLVTAITMCLIPLFDTIASIIRRWKLGVSFFTADRFHVHHKLLNLGLSTRQSLAVIYVFALISGACVLSVAYVGYTASWFIMMGAWLVVFVFFMVMHYVKVNNIQIGYRSIDKPSFNKEPEE